jgi:hypothetical protein
VQQVRAGQEAGIAERQDGRAVAGEIHHRLGLVLVDAGLRVEGVVAACTEIRISEADLGSGRRCQMLRRPPCCGLGHGAADAGLCVECVIAAQSDMKSAYGVVLVRSYFPLGSGLLRGPWRTDPHWAVKASMLHRQRHTSVHDVLPIQSTV